MTATHVLSALIAVIGIVLVVQGVVAGALLRILVGILFVVAGAGRLYLESRR